MAIDVFLEMNIYNNGKLFLRLDKIIYVSYYDAGERWKLFVCYGDDEDSNTLIEFDKEQDCIDYAKEVMTKVNGYIEHKAKTLGQIL